MATSSYEIFVAIIQDKPVNNNNKRCMVVAKILTAKMFVTNTTIKCLSKYGNPSYWITFVSKDGRKFKGYTASNAQCGYSASNFVGKLSEIKYHYSPAGNLIIDTMKGEEV